MVYNWWDETQKLVVDLFEQQQMHQIIFNIFAVNTMCFVWWIIDGKIFHLFTLISNVNVLTNSFYFHKINNLGFCVFSHHLMSNVKSESWSKTSRKSHLYSTNSSPPAHIK